MSAPSPTLPIAQPPARKLYLEGEAAVVAVRRLLARPGVLGIDFETNVAARLTDRIPYVLSLVHANRVELVVRLAGRGAELPAMFRDHDWHGAELVAHNAAFECGVLRKYGVARDVDCTLVASLCLDRVAVRAGTRQPLEHSLAALAERELGMIRDKTIRDRDWSTVEALDQMGVSYALEDARNARDLWAVLRARLRASGLWRGYRLVLDSILPTVEMNLAGMKLDHDAHGKLCARLEATTLERKAELDQLAGTALNHGSTKQVTGWIVGQVLGLEQIDPPKRPKVGPTLVQALARDGGLKRDPRLTKLGLPRKLIRPIKGKDLAAAAGAAWTQGYLADNQPETLLTALCADLDPRTGPVLAEPDRAAWRVYRAAQRKHEATLAATKGASRSDLLEQFDIRVRALTGASWKRTTRELKLDKGIMARKPPLLRSRWPEVAEYLTIRARWTKGKKLLDTFGPSLRLMVPDPEKSRLYGQFQPFQAVTGRQSCVDPNIQQMPTEPEFRALFVAPAGRKLVICDYSQIELRILAIVSQDSRLLMVYQQDLDVHDETMRVTKVSTRRLAKNVNFSIAYGGGAGGLAENYGLPIDEAEIFIARFMAAYPGVETYRKQAAAGVGDIAIRPNRRVRWDAKLDTPKTTRINYPIQGGAASVQMRALRLVRDGLLAAKLDAFLVASVHDELLIEASEADAPAAAEILQDGMRAALLEVYPEAVAMNAANLAEAAIVDSWAAKV